MCTWADSKDLSFCVFWAGHNLQANLVGDGDCGNVLASLGNALMDSTHSPHITQAMTCRQASIYSPYILLTSI